MDPVFDKGHNTIAVVPQSPDEIQIGDIISYFNEDLNGIVIHRVIETGQDENGWYAIVKGDNNPTPDPGKVRFAQIKRVVIAIVY